MLIISILLFLRMSAYAYALVETSLKNLVRGRFSVLTNSYLLPVTEAFSVQRGGVRRLRLVMPSQPNIKKLLVLRVVVEVRAIYD